PGADVQTRTASGAAQNLYLSMVKQKPGPVPSILGLPSAALQEGDALTLTSSVSDPDSVAFTYSGVVLRDGEDYATGNNSTFTAHFTDQGVYAVTLTVTDPDGNVATTTGTVDVNNSAPVLAATAFGAPTATSNYTAAASDNFGTAL